MTVTPATCQNIHGTERLAIEPVVSSQHVHIIEMSASKPVRVTYDIDLLRYWYFICYYSFFMCQFKTI